MSLIFLAMTACVSDGSAPDEPVPVRVTIDYPDGCEPTEGFPHRYVITRAGRSGDPVPVGNPAEPFTVLVQPGAALTIMTAFCRVEGEACCQVTTEHRFAPGSALPAAIVVEIPDPRTASR